MTTGVGEGDSQTPFRDGLFDEDDSFTGSASLTTSSYDGGMLCTSDTGEKLSSS